jgi:SAM-dependent methyltransferase
MQFSEILNWYQTFTPELEQRKNWYGSITEAYDRVRPKYTPEFIDRVLAVAEISSTAKILEIGCGPGTATIELAKQGLSLVCLEPSLDACTLARHNLANYPNVEIINNNFEEWEPENRKFDAILAATSWHWVSPEHKHIKSASLLKDGGKLILLWNTGMQPDPAIFQSLIEPLTQYMPTLAQYKDRDTQLNEISIFARSAVDSGLFSEFDEECQTTEVNYSIDDYLQLLTTYSPCIALSPADRKKLLTELRSILVQNCGEHISLAYFSIFQIAKLSSHPRILL